MANSLYLDAELLENDLRKIIRTAIRKKEAIKQFGEIYLVPADTDLNEKILFPAVSIEVHKNGPYALTQEDIEVEPFSRFSVTVETYTNGSNKRSMNMRLAQFITSILQTNQQLENYYNRGLKLDQERELSSFIEGVSRRVVRFSGVVDNASKLIYNKEI